MPWIISAIFLPIILPFLVFFLSLIGINIPLLLFDCLLKIVNVVSGSALFNQLINGVYKFNAADPIFITYMIIVGLSFFIIVFGIIKTAAKTSINPNYEVNNDHKKHIIFKKFKWIFIWIISIFGIPIIFTIATMLLSMISSMFGINSYTITPFSQNLVLQVVSNYQDNISSLQINNQSLINFINNNKAILPTDINLNQILNELTAQNIFLKDFYNQLSTINFLDSSNNLSEATSNNLNKVISNLINFNSVDCTNLNYWLMNSSISQKDEGLKLINELNSSQVAFSTFLAKGTIVDNQLITLNQIYYQNSGSYYNGWRAEKLTLQIASAIYGTNITNIGGLFETASFTFNVGITWDLTNIIRLVVGSFVSIGIFFSMINILLRVSKRLFELVYLLLISPLAISNGVNDNGAKYDLWLKTTIGKMIIVIVISLCFQILQLIATPIFSWTSLINFGTNTFMTEILQTITGLFLIFSCFVAINEIIDLTSSSIGDSSRLNNSGKTARKHAQKAMPYLSKIKKPDPSINKLNQIKKILG